MRRIGYWIIVLIMFCLPVNGLATFKPVDLNPQIKSGALVQKTENIIVVFDKSASMSELTGEMRINDTRLIQAKDATKNMVAAIPEIKLNMGLKTFWSEETAQLYGMKPLVKGDYTAAVNGIENVNGRTPMAKAITAAGNDLKLAGGNSALIIISDFSQMPGIDDIRPEAVMEAITAVNADYGDKLCVYAIQLGYAADGKELSERIVQNVDGGYTVNADELVTPTAMAAFVDKVISGNCSRYQKVVKNQPDMAFVPAADPVVEEEVVAVAPEPKAEETVVAAAPEPKAEETVAAVVAGPEPKAEEEVIVLAFENVHFDFDRSILKPEAQTILNRNIQLLKDNPDSKVRIAGYTSASGSDAYNQKLSERRANAVQQYLITEGIITRERLSTIGYGETYPEMYEAAPKVIRSVAAKANMRVLFEVIAQ